jgi:hypothetical protein
MPNELQPQGAWKLQGRRIEAPGLPALVLPVDARRWVLADNKRRASACKGTQTALCSELRPHNSSSRVRRLRNTAGAEVSADRCNEEKAKVKFALTMEAALDILTV